jgi:hypothetical protein
VFLCECSSWVVGGAKRDATGWDNVIRGMLTDLCV